ncbi:uncharacterized protein LOC107362138 isoform X1 [Tetranychus urticae]|uniref:uncharacterized protein LOC107362138 isoform X1 n=1 Tax=Tetranychus urticae TaxID=32264 RepID=UPI000D64D53E|nr:uncharacterized protein LOC107362138 isoform X1 [Tetranychus urticae]
MVKYKNTSSSTARLLSLILLLLKCFLSFTSQQSTSINTSTPGPTSTLNPKNPTPFEFEFRSLKIVKPSVAIKNLTRPLDDFFHIGVYFVLHKDQTFSNPKTTIKSSPESFLTKQIAEANKVLSRYTIALYLIDYIFIQSPFPSPTYYNIYKRVTNILSTTIGFPVITIFVDEKVPNQWHVTKNNTFAPCGPTFFHWNPTLTSIDQTTNETRRIRFLYGNVIFKLFNSDTAVCTLCKDACFKELADKQWTEVKFYHSECLHQNMRESYYLGPFTCFTVLPMFTRRPHCGNGVIEGKEQCDCIGPCGHCRFNCTLKPRKQSASSSFITPSFKIAVLGVAFLALLVSGTFLLLRDSGKILAFFGSPTPIDRFRPDPQQQQQQQQQQQLQQPPELQMNKSKA